MFNGNKAIFGPECDKRIIAKWKEYGGMELLRGQEYSRFEVDFFFTPEFLGNTPGAKVQRNSTPRSTVNRCFKWLDSLNPNAENDGFLLNHVNALRESWILDSIDAGKLLPNSDYIVSEDLKWSNKKVYEPLSETKKRLDRNRNFANGNSGSGSSSSNITNGNSNNKKTSSPTIRHIDFNNVKKSSIKKRKKPADNNNNDENDNNSTNIDDLYEEQYRKYHVEIDDDSSYAFDCDYGCGYISTFKAVSEHEKWCRKNPNSLLNKKENKNCIIVPSSSSNNNNNKKRKVANVNNHDIEKNDDDENNDDDDVLTDLPDSNTFNDNNNNNSNSGSSSSSSNNNTNKVLLTPSATQDMMTTTTTATTTSNGNDGSSKKSISSELEYNEFGYPIDSRWKKRDDRVLQELETTIEDNNLEDADDLHAILLEQGFDADEIQNRRLSNISNKPSTLEDGDDNDDLSDDDDDNSELY